MVSEALSKRIYGLTRLMLIYGNTPRDIMAMIWRRRYKFVSIFAVIVIAVMLLGCTGNRSTPSTIPLKALDKFWDALGGKTEDLVEETE